jgi:hypothetical protein
MLWLIACSVVLIYDSVRTAQGQLAIKALRLTDQFCDAHRAKRITAEGYVGFMWGASPKISYEFSRSLNLSTCSFAALSPSQIFEELPIRVHNAHLVQMLLLDLLGETPIAPVPSASMSSSVLPTTAQVALGAAATAAVSGVPERFHDEICFTA